MIYDVLNPPSGLNPITADGSTDDIVNLQAMINNLSVNGGGKLVFPGGRTVAISRPILVKSNVSMKTNGENVTFVIKDQQGYIDDNDPMTAPMRSCIGIVNRENVSITGFTFEITPPGTNGELVDTLGQAVYIENSSNVVVDDCCFKKLSDVNDTVGILVKGAEDLSIKQNYFEETDTGIKVLDLNKRVRISDNLFLNLNQHGIFFIGETDENDLANSLFSSDVWIENNRIIMKQLANGNDFHGIYFTCGNTQFVKDTTHHENVIVANNTVSGPLNLSNASGGTPDLFSLKDIIRLKCYGNTARNSGDLGYAIERCHGGIVSNNIAVQNNSCGISIFGSSNMSVTGNVCGNNEQDHDDALNHPYGGIRVEFDSVHVVLSGNHFYGEGLQNEENQQQYGIVVRPATVTEITDTTVQTRTPFNIKIGVNHYTDHYLGDIYDDGTSTIIQDSSATVTTP